MTTHKTEDYKKSAVKYYLTNDKGDGYKRTCKIFDCKKSTLRDWIKRYQTSKNLTRRNRKSISYKITKPQVNTALDLLKQNEQLTMNELLVDMKNKYPTFDITYLIGKKLPMMKKGLSTETYIDELADYTQLQNKKIVSIDPGLCDLIYCVDADNTDAKKFRYSQDQRRKETKKKKY